MKKKVYLALGLFIFLLGVSGNLQWAAADYGYHSISLNPQILAQDSGSGGNEVRCGTVNKSTGGVSAGDGGSRTFGKEKGPCEFVLAGQGTAEIHFMGGKITPNANGTLSVLFKNASIDCTVDGKYTDCTTITCLEFYERLFK